jgi:hypothetical protein
MTVKSWENHRGVSLDSVNNFDVIECETCGFKHIVPTPTADEMEQYYSEQFHREKPTYVDRYQEDIDWWRLVYTQKRDLYSALAENGMGRELVILTKKKVEKN